jgi:carboxylesterase type B
MYRPRSIAGSAGRGIAVLRGFAFAGGAVDDNRWRPRTASPDWQDMRDAGKAGLTCL